MFPMLDAAISARIVEEVTKDPGIRLVDIVVLMTHVLVEDGTGRPVDLITMIEALVQEGHLIKVAYQTNSSTKIKTLLFPRFTEIQVIAKM